jgi:hypothetical protein
MVTIQRSVAYVLLCSLAITTVGCTSMKTIRPTSHPAGSAAFGKLKAGDTVDVRTSDGRRARFVVQQVDGDAIVAPDGVRYTSAEIAELKRRSFSGPKTAGLVAGIFGGMFLLAAAAVASALDGLLGS